MSRDLLAALALVGLAAHGRGSALANPGSCRHREGEACEAGDHSLIQVVSRLPVHNKKSARDGHGGKRVPASGSSTSTPARKEKVELFGRSRAQSRKGAPAPVGINGVVENRTIANITASLKVDLEDLESFVNLMAMGKHKLCAAEQKNAERVETLMRLMRLQALLQASPLEAPQQHRDSLEAMQKAEYGESGTWCPSWFPGCGNQQAQQSNPVVTVVSDSVNANKHVDNRTLSNISADVGTEVTSVRNIMDDIQHEGDRLEVLSKETGERVSVLLALLSKETQQCETSGEYSYGGMLQAANKSQEQRQRANPTEQSVLQAATQHANKRMSRADIQMLLEGPVTADMNMTFINLTNTIQNVTSQLVGDVNALILQKNDLSIASQEDAGSIDNLEDNLKGQTSGVGASRGGYPPELVLQIGQAINSQKAPVPDAHTAAAQQAAAAPVVQQAPAADAIQQATAAPVVPPAAASSATSQVGNGTTTAELQAKDMKKQAGAEAVIAAATARADKAEKSADESRRLAAAEAEEIKNLKAETAKKATEQQQAKATPAAKVDLAMEDIPVVNLTWAVDKHVVGLESDVSLMAEQRHEVCWVSKNTQDRLTVISQILTTIKC